MGLEQRFRAGRFEDALAEVRRVLGPDALIVSRRQVRSGRALDGGGSLVEITALSAADARRQGTGPDVASTSGMLERRLIRNGVPTGAARALSARVGSELRRRPHGPGQYQAALGCALKHEMLFGRSVGERTRAAALVGPTGVGKTTTIAKLAAGAALIQGRRVGLVSLDQYRVGGIEQLQRYADLIGVEMHSAYDARSLEVALRRLSDADLLLIDTAGRSPRDIAAFQELAECLAGAQEPVEVYLCVPAAMRSQELSLLSNQQNVLEPTRMIATKVDEAVGCEGIVAAQCETGLPLAYVTTGQRVPEDIEPASPELMASLLSGQEFSSS